MIINYDCRYFMSDRPCTPHKKTGVHCNVCSEYKSIKLKILIIKLNAIGDVLRTTGIVPSLLLKYPGAHITWVADSEARPLLEMVSGIDRIWDCGDKILMHLLTEPFDLVFGLDNSKDCASLVYLSRGKRKLGFSCDDEGKVIALSPAAEIWFEMGLWDDLKRNNRRTYQDILWDICELAKPTMSPQINVSDSLKIEATKFAEKCGILKKKPIIGFFSGAGSRWPHKALAFEKQKDLLCKLVGEYKNGAIILFGGPFETKSNRLLLEKVTSNVIDAGCNNSLPIFTSLINLVDLFITGDTLPLHIALALKKKVVVYFGPTSPWEIDLFGMGEKVIAPVDCITCYKSSCEESTTCSDLISVKEILSAVDNVLHSA